ncbi:hypothetical protein FKW77_004716 [Venturia effusa]|uniref:Uncharacterized protein n=1 Tax=Venturia effusa TaxID=50376 RepID=A0A517LDS5_9PEZI|nr:hypothetical protein FKW77_004716 [Venturia effusa]
MLLHRSIPITTSSPPIDTPTDKPTDTEIDFPADTPMNTQTNTPTIPPTNTPPDTQTSPSQPTPNATPNPFTPPFPEDDMDDILSPFPPSSPDDMDAILSPGPSSPLTAGPSPPPSLEREHPAHHKVPAAAIAVPVLIGLLVVLGLAFCIWRSHNRQRGWRSRNYEREGGATGEWYGQEGKAGVERGSVEFFGKGGKAASFSSCEDAGVAVPKKVVR